MTIGGWAFMLLSVSFVIGLTGFCFYRILTIPTAQPHTEHHPVKVQQG
jgi:hypothetical protein